jgi:hypothetical protein
VKGKVYGRYDDENKAALARDYAARGIASLSGTKVQKVNSAQFFLEDAAEKSRIDRWVDETVMHTSGRFCMVFRRVNGMMVLYFT